MEAVLISRNPGGESTTDRTLDLVLAGEPSRVAATLQGLPHLAADQILSRTSTGHGKRNRQALDSL